MTTLQSITKKLSPLGVYNISEGADIYAELSAYAYALDRLKSNMDTVLRECFITTSESYGIETREKVFGNLRTSYSLPQRREMLRLRRGFGDSDYTLAGFDKFMTSLGVGSYNVLEMYGSYEVTVTMYNTFSSTDAEWIENQINLIMPAHLLVYVYYGGSTFFEIDSVDLTYAQFDNNDRTWTQIDSN